MFKISRIGVKPEQSDDMDVFHKLAQQFLPYAHKNLGFDKPVNINLMSDPNNAKDPLGKTAYYDPNKMEVTLFVDKRHVKDILRSLSHELVHHTQNCRGDFDKGMNTGPGYAQNDEHMRKCEGEAYLQGSGFLFRDWEDSLKKENQAMSESKVNEEQSIWAPSHYCVHHGGVYMEGQMKIGKVVRHNWNKNLKRVTKYDMQFQDGTIVENIKAEDILVTEASLAEMGHGGKKDDKHPPSREDEDDRKDEGLEDLSGDGKVTQKDVLIGKGVLDKDGNPKSKKEKVDEIDAHLDEEYDMLMQEAEGDDEDEESSEEEEQKQSNLRTAQSVGKRKEGDPPVPAKKIKKENWTRGNKNQILFEKLTKKWTK